MRSIAIFATRVSAWRWNPEFTMLEFYQAYTDYRGVMELTQKLIEQAAIDVTGGTKTKWGEDEIDWAERNWRRMTMREAIIQLLAGSSRRQAGDGRFRHARFGEGIGSALQPWARARGLRSE